MKNIFYLVLVILSVLSIFKFVEKKPITQKKAIEIASRHLVGEPDLGERERVFASLQDRKYIITFVMSFTGHAGEVRRTVHVDSITGKVLFSTADPD